MGKKFVKVAICLLFCCSCVFDAVVASNIDAKIQKSLDAYRSLFAKSYDNISAGMALSVKFPGSRGIKSYYSGTISKDSKNPVTANNLFEIASITKPFTAVSILKLHEADKIDLNAPLKDYLIACDDPSGKECLTNEEYQKWGNITIRQLMNHTSGIPNMMDNQNFLQILLQDHEKAWTPEELVQYADSLPEYFPAGKGWHYSNTDYVLLGMIARRIYGSSISAAMQSVIFDPLSLSSTFFLPKSPADSDFPQKVKARLLHGYNNEYGGMNVDVTDFNLSYADTSGAIISNSRDLVRFINDLFADKILDKQIMSQMTHIVCTGKPVRKGGVSRCTPGSASVPYDTLGYGLGIMRGYDLKNPKVGYFWGHEGDAPGFEALALWFPKVNTTVAIGANVSGKYVLYSLAEEVVNDILHSLEYRGTKIYA